nr:MAG TPA: hypothetical protein [Caudoviricetes sp.]
MSTPHKSANIMLMGERWVGVRKIHKLFCVRGVV